MLKGRCPLLHRCRFSTKQTLNSQECFCAGGAALLIHLLSDWIRVAPAGRRHQLEDKDLGPFTRLQALGRVGDAKLPSWPRGPAMDRQTPNESWWDWGGFGLQVDPEPQSFSSGLSPSLATTASSSLRSHSFTPDLILSLFFFGKTKSPSSLCRFLRKFLWAGFLVQPWLPPCCLPRPFVSIFIRGPTETPSAPGGRGQREGSRVHAFDSPHKPHHSLERATSTWPQSEASYWPDLEIAVQL